MDYHATYNKTTAIHKIVELEKECARLAQNNFKKNNVTYNLDLEKENERLKNQHNKLNNAVNECHKLEDELKEEIKKLKHQNKQANNYIDSIEKTHENLWNKLHDKKEKYRLQTIKDLKTIHHLASVQAEMEEDAKNG